MSTTTTMTPNTALFAAPDEFSKKMREDEIRMKINQLRKAGRLKGVGDTRAMKESLKFFNKQSPLDKYADKIKAAQDRKDRNATESSTVVKTTSGIGGSWSPPTSTNSTDKDGEASYKPARGSWGAFERPADISKAYGGGKKIGAGVEKTEAELEREKQKDMSTAEKLKAYRER